MTTGSEKYSKTVSESLDNLGYSQDMIEYRRKHYNTIDILKNVHLFFENAPFTHMLVGSKCEGVTRPAESDIDVMCIMRNAICVNDQCLIIDQTSLTIFHTDIQEANPGYTRLKLKLGELGKTPLRDILFQERDGELYISSDFLTDYVTNYSKYKYFEKVKKQGPACNIVSGPNAIIYGNIDIVFAFRCMCPGLLSAYLNRPRNHGWPPKHVLEEISTADAHVVPAGNKESQNSYKEWRICFTKAEIILIRSLNDTQTKLYILLKMVCKSMITKTFPAITSYVIKNIVLWMVETNPRELFTEELLLERLIQSIFFLRIRVKCGFIPSYMIPDRNLLAGRIDGIQQLELVTLLTSLIETGPYLVLKCPKLYRGLAMIYSQPNWVAMNSNNIEKLVLLLEKENCNRFQTKTVDQIKYEYFQIHPIIIDIVMLDRMIRNQNLEDVVTRMVRKFRKILS